MAEPTYTPQSEYGKELRKWDTPKSQGGHRPNGYEHFPLMMFRAARRPDGVPTTGDSVDAPYGGAPGQAEQFRMGLRLTVHDETEMQRAMENGWRETIKEAMDFFLSRERAIADTAAHRNYEDRNMSEAAKAEAREAEGDSVLHVPVIEEKPKRKYTRRIKTEG